jgi:hypothetical protein
MACVACMGVAAPYQSGLAALATAHSMMPNPRSAHCPRPQAHHSPTKNPLLRRLCPRPTCCFAALFHTSRLQTSLQHTSASLHAKRSCSIAVQVPPPSPPVHAIKPDSFPFPSPCVGARLTLISRPLCYDPASVVGLGPHWPLTSAVCSPTVPQSLNQGGCAASEATTASRTRSQLNTSPSQPLPPRVCGTRHSSHQTTAGKHPTSSSLLTDKVSP